jgi:hypothetical protein
MSSAEQEERSVSRKIGANMPSGSENTTLNANRGDAWRKRKEEPQT